MISYSSHVTIFGRNKLKGCALEMNIEETVDLECHCFNGAYRIIAEKLIDVNLRNKVIKILYNEFSGQCVSFPKRLLSDEYTHSQIIKEYNGYNAKELARKYDYTYSWVMKVLKKHGCT